MQQVELQSEGTCNNALKGNLDKGSNEDYKFKFCF